jgi:hypothetical protein
MIRLISRLLFVCAVLSTGLQSKVGPASAAAPESSASPGLVVRLHSIGFSHLPADGNGTVFRDILNLPVSTQLRDDTLDKVAAALGSQFEAKAQPAKGSCARLIRPLLTDVCTSEACLELIQHPQAVLESTCAVHLDEARRQVWERTLSQLVSDWQWRYGEIKVLVTNSWAAVQLVRGQSQASEVAGSETSVFHKLQQGQRPVAAAQDYWVRLESDLPKFLALLGKSKALAWPNVDLTVAGKKEYLRTQAKLTFPAPLSVHVEKWEVPTETIRDPLISFTAIQGITRWLQQQPFIKGMGLSTIPNQVYLWALSQTAFQIQGAALLPDAPAAFDHIAQKSVPKYNEILATNSVGHIQRLADRPELVWHGLPLLVPYLDPIRENGRSYLHGGIFPVNPPTNPPPAALFAQLNRPNLVYYEWEITQARLEQLRPLLQLAGLFLTIAPMSTNSSAFKWLDAIEPRVGNAATDIALTSPTELNLTRTSHLGLNGLELVTLANWLEGTNFPRINMDVGFRPVIKSSRQKPKH